MRSPLVVSLAAARAARNETLRRAAAFSISALVVLSAALLGQAAIAQTDGGPEAAIRKSLAERMPSLPKIDEVRKAAVQGLYEVRYGGTEIIYVDAAARHAFQGSIIELKTLRDLTQARIDQITAIDFSKLPLKDAVAVKQGNGQRKIAVFADPNCGYCKRLERDFATIKDVTIYTFLVPILGPDSITKSRNIWCGSDPRKAWRAWMVDGIEPPAAGDGKCAEEVFARKLALARKHRVTGTPAIVFEDGTRKPGAIPAAEVERLLASAERKSR